MLCRPPVSFIKGFEGPDYAKENVATLRLDSDLFVFAVDNVDLKKPIYPDLMPRGFFSTSFEKEKEYIEKYGKNGARAIKDAVDRRPVKDILLLPGIRSLKMLAARDSFLVEESDPSYFDSQYFSMGSRASHFWLVQSDGILVKRLNLNPFHRGGDKYLKEFGIYREVILNVKAGHNYRMFSYIVDTASSLMQKPTFYMRDPTGSIQEAFIGEDNLLMLKFLKGLKPHYEPQDATLAFFGLIPKPYYWEISVIDETENKEIDIQINDKSLNIPW